MIGDPATPEAVPIVSHARLVDARALDDGATLEAGTCVIGAGPAGLTVAGELGASGEDVLVVDSGGPAHEPELDELNAGTTHGDNYADLRWSRRRRVGGAAWAWNTYAGNICGARYLPLDPIDLEPRPWSPDGWPIAHEELLPWWRRAHSRCLLAPLETAYAHGAIEPVFAADPLEPGAYAFGPATAFTHGARHVLSAARLAEYATVTRLELDAAGEHVTGAAWAAPGGRHGRIVARRFVLALGAIENARLLLASAATPDRAPGNRHGLVGRGFMEHPRDRTLRLVLPSSAPRERLAFHSLRGGGGVRWGRLGLSPALLRAQALPNASVSLAAETEAAPHGTFAALQRALFRRGPRVASMAIEITVEQAPDDANRVTLGAERDGFGMPRVALEWRLGDADRERIARVRDVVATTLARTSHGHIERHREPLVDPNAHHHAGTTRMHDDPARGVVDANGRVHGMANLWVTGGSVFPTCGHANPTLTIVALALRLGTHLAAGRAPAVTHAAPAPPRG